VTSAGLENTRAVSFDVNDAGALAGHLTQLTREHGTPDGVVHLAYASSSGKHLAELSPAEFQRTLDLALPSTFVLCRTVAGPQLFVDGRQFRNRHGIRGVDSDCFAKLDDGRARVAALHQ
jgi:NAD(P)-dependent dehydrogenase (short-subunit alcohol dehydrogenase family)